jgi:hypothetical protein
MRTSERLSVVVFPNSPGGSPGALRIKQGGLMGVGVSILLIAAGAILTWAVTATVSGVSIQTVGVILLIVGIVGLVLSMIFWSSWGGVGGARRRTTYVDEVPPGY